MFTNGFHIPYNGKFNTKNVVFFQHAMLDEVTYIEEQECHYLILHFS